MVDCDPACGEGWGIQCEKVYVDESCVVVSASDVRRELCPGFKTTVLVG